MVKKIVNKQQNRGPENGEISQVVSETRRQSITPNGKLSNGWIQPSGLSYKVCFYKAKLQYALAINQFTSIFKF